MAQSFIPSVPFAAPDSVPWNWNPGATFVTAFNETRLAQARAKEMEVANQLESILLPYKQKQAALALDKLQFDVELQSARLDQERVAAKQAYRSLKDSISGSGSNAAGNGVGGTGQQDAFTIDTSGFNTAPKKQANSAGTVTLP